MSSRNSLHDFFEHVSAPDEENTIESTQFADGQEEIAENDPSPRLDTHTLSNDTLIEEYVVVKILNIDTEKSVLSNNPKVRGANIRHNGRTNDHTVTNVNHLTDTCSEDAHSRRTRSLHAKLYTDKGKFDSQYRSTDDDKRLLIRADNKEENTEMSVSNRVENIPSVEGLPDKLNELFGQGQTGDHAVDDAGNTGDVVRVKDVMNTDTNSHPVSGTNVNLGNNETGNVPNAGKYADPSVDRHIKGNTVNGQFTSLTNEGTNSQHEVNNYTNVDVVDPNISNAVGKHISVGPGDRRRENRVIDISTIDKVGDAVRQNSIYDDTDTETEVDKTTGFGKIEGVSKNITHAETDVDAENDKNKNVDTFHDGQDDGIYGDSNVDHEIDTCISVGNHDAERDDSMYEDDVGDADENNDDDNENTIFEMDDKPNDDNGDGLTSTEHGHIDDDNPFLSSKDITAKGVKVNGVNVPLSSRKTTCHNVRLRLSDDGLCKRPGGGRVKPGTPYPFHGLVRAVDVPSGALGDSLKPALNDPDAHEVADNSSRTNQYSVELGPTPVIPGKLSETPRFSSVLREIEMRPNSGTATAISDSSGRKNPQAKVDSEVRPLAGVTQLELFRRNLVAVRPDRRSLPPIQIAKKLANGATEINATKYTRSQETKMSKTKMEHNIKLQSQVVRETRKPAVPRILKSSVCYHEGKVDVSIFSDQVLVNRSDQVHLNINFLRRPLAQTIVTKSAQQNRDNRAGLDPVTRPVLSGVKSTRVPAHQQPKRSSLPRRLRTDGKQNKYLAPIQNAPKIKTYASNDTKQKQNRDKATSYSNKPSKAKRNIRLQRHVNLWSRRLEPLDWNIVNRRAQKPPFNTHTNPDASYRHMQFFMDY